MKRKWGFIFFFKKNSSPRRPGKEEKMGGFDSGGGFWKAEGRKMPRHSRGFVVISLLCMYKILFPYVCISWHALKISFRSIPITLNKQHTHVFPPPPSHKDRQKPHGGIVIRTMTPTNIQRTPPFLLRFPRGNKKRSVRGREGDLPHLNPEIPWMKEEAGFFSE